MTHPIPSSAHPGVYAEFAALVRRHHTAASLAAAGAEWMPDVSEFNDVVDMAAVKRAGAAGVIIRSSFGTVRADHRWEANRANADAAGLPWLAYHVAYPAYNRPVDEGAFANEVVGPLPHGCGQAGDFENDPGALAWPGGQQAHDWAAGFLTALGPADYLPPWYCSTSFVGPHALGPLATTWPWWEAAYGVSAPDELGLAPVMWQQTDRASVAGVSGPCDVSIMLRGSFAALLYGGTMSEADVLAAIAETSKATHNTYDLLAATAGQVQAMLAAEGLEATAIAALGANAAAASQVAAALGALADLKTAVAALPGGVQENQPVLDALGRLEGYAQKTATHLGVGTP